MLKFLNKVKIKKNTLATIEKIELFQPDHVIVAVGATRDAPPIPGKELNHVFDGEQLRGLLFGSDDKAIKKLLPYLNQEKKIETQVYDNLFELNFNKEIAVEKYQTVYNIL